MSHCRPRGQTNPNGPPQDEWTAKAQEIVTIAGQRDGYCLVLGVGTGRLMEELASQYPDMRVIGLDPDADKIETLRTRWGKLNIPHQRLSALVGDIVSAQLPPYLANLVVSEDIESAGTAHGDVFVEKVFYSLRPYGGRVCLGADLQTLFRSGVDAAGLANAEVRREGQYTILERPAHCRARRTGLINTPMPPTRSCPRINW